MTNIITINIKPVKVIISKYFKNEKNDVKFNYRSFLFINILNILVYFGINIFGWKNIIIHIKIN
jgi:hypothetical protein